MKQHFLGEILWEGSGTELIWCVVCSALPHPSPQPRYTSFLSTQFKPSFQDSDAKIRLSGSHAKIHDQEYLDFNFLWLYESVLSGNDNSRWQLVHEQWAASFMIDNSKLGNQFPVTEIPISSGRRVGSGCHESLRTSNTGRKDPASAWAAH